jgi:hypothetical protein
LTHASDDSRDIKFKCGEVQCSATTPTYLVSSHEAHFCNNNLSLITVYNLQFLYYFLVGAKQISDPRCGVEFCSKWCEAPDLYNLPAGLCSNRVLKLRYDGHWAGGAITTDTELPHEMLYGLMFRATHEAEDKSVGRCGYYRHCIHYRHYYKRRIIRTAAVFHAAALMAMDGIQ